MKTKESHAKARSREENKKISLSFLRAFAPSRETNSVFFAPFVPLCGYSF
jgi:hypothetical protein